MCSCSKYLHLLACHVVGFIVDISPIREVDEVSDDLPDEFLKTKILPELLRSIEYGGGGPKVFGLIVKLSAKLSEEEYESSITPVIIRLFASRDRAIRVCLLDNLPSLIDHLPQKLVNDKIFPQMVGYLFRIVNRPN